MKKINPDLACDHCGEIGNTIPSESGDYCSLECATDDIGRACYKLAQKLEEDDDESEELIQLLIDRFHKGSRSPEY